MIRLLIVEDRPEIRRGLRMRLSAELDIAVIGEAASAELLVEQVQVLRPQVVLMDIEFPPGSDGIAAAVELGRRVPEVAVVLLTIHDDAACRARAKRAGAKAFVPKSAPIECLLDAIRGTSCLSPGAPVA